MAAKQRRQLFPEKLWDLVNKPTSGIKWSPDGKRIEVERSQLEKFLQTKLCDRNFQGSQQTKFRSHNFDSFIRQLHFYGFKKSGNSYHHDKFQRGQPEALHTMKRKYSNISIPISSNSEYHRISKLKETMQPTQSLMPISNSMMTKTQTLATKTTILDSSDSGRNEVTMYTLKPTGSSEDLAFDSVREDKVKATSDERSIRIAIPANMNDNTGKNVWPKTLVLDNYWNGNQNILSAYFIYRLN